MSSQPQTFPKNRPPNNTFFINHQTPPKNQPPFWVFNKADPDSGTPAELVLYGDISSTTWYGDEITPLLFDRDLKALGDVSEIVVRINSGGGDVFAAFAIYCRLKDHPAFITIKIDGWCGSAATVIACAGDKVLIPAVANYMVHPPAIGLHGFFRETDLLGLAEELRSVKNSIIKAYEAKTGKTAEELEGMVDASKWLTGEETVQNGFADELMFQEIQTQAVEDSRKIIVNSVEFDLARFPNVPENLLPSRAAAGGGGFHIDDHTPTPQQKQPVKERVNMDPNKIMTVEDLEREFPQLVAQIRQTATDAATAAERKRIQDIEGVALNGYETVVQAAKFDQPMAAADVAMKIVAMQKQQGGVFMQEREEDMKESGLDDLGGSDPGMESPSDNNGGLDLLKVVQDMYPDNPQ